MYTVAQEADIPSELGADNADYVKRCLVGAATRPRKVYLSVVDAEGTADTALEQLTPLDYDYVAGFPDADAADAKALADAVIAKRKGNYIGKAVVANHTADNVGVINFTTSGIQVPPVPTAASPWRKRGRCGGLLLPDRRHPHRGTPGGQRHRLGPAGGDSGGPPRLTRRPTPPLRPES